MLERFILSLTMPDAMIHSVGLRRRRSASRTEGLRVKIRTDARTVLTLRMAPLCLLPLFIVALCELFGIWRPLRVRISGRWAEGRKS